MVSMQDINVYSRNLRTIYTSAAQELTSNLVSLPAMSETQARAAIRQIIRNIMDKYGLSAQELGAQWYEYAAQQAGVSVDPAIISELDTQALEEAAERLMYDYLNDEQVWSEIEQQLQELIQDAIREAARQATIENLDRDRSLEVRSRRPARAGYARVPVGETCAWCLMLASLGFWYRSEETALGIDPDHYHRGCDCVAVPYTDPTDIAGYDAYNTYLDMYSEADYAVRHDELTDELRARIERARQRHEQAYERGETNKKWSRTNETLIVMRVQNNLEH